MVSSNTLIQPFTQNSQKVQHLSKKKGIGKLNLFTRLQWNKGHTFLNGDLTLFHEIRKEQNKNRGPYKIHSPNENGNYITTDESKSVEQKKKYS